MSKSLISQLIEFHRSEPWQNQEESDESLSQYFSGLLDKRRIIVYVEGDELIGYVESWRLNFDQLGRILCGAKFSACSEDVSSGNIAHVANVHIKQGHRKSHVIKFLRDSFMKQNFSCDYFVGEARRKKHQPFKCFKRSEFIKKHMKGDENGK